MSDKQLAVKAATDAGTIRTFLSRPSSYLELTKAVDIRETHISQVFLTDDYAYKLKKPVRYDFLDFSTSEKRRLACEDELRLNRRLADDVYLEVLPITVDDDQQLSLNGDGAVVDWVVKMRRLPDDRSLKSMIATGGVTTGDIARVSGRLFEFYGQLPPAELSGASYRAEIEAHVRANSAALLEDSTVCDDVVKRVTAAQLRLLHTSPELFNERAQHGRVVEGHGDLRPEHIYLTPDPVAIDCIEFNSSFRRIDIVDELCFLAMECSHLGAGWIAEELLRNYEASTGDHPADALRAFYATYRACVRGKVKVLRARQVPESSKKQYVNDAVKYLDLADRTAKGLGKPSIIVVRGAAGTGKSTLARAIVELLGTEYVQTDAVRIALFGASTALAGFDEGRYSAGNRSLVYQVAVSGAEEFLLRGLPVVLDGTFLTNDQQRSVVNVASRCGTQAIFVNCSCPGEVAMARIEKRFNDRDRKSDAQYDTHLKHLQIEERPPAEFPQCDIDTTRPLPRMVKRVLHCVKEHMTY